MKRITHYLIAALSCISITAAIMTASAQAANRAEQFSVSPVIGGITFDGVQHLETRPFVGLRAGYNFTDHFGVEALFDYARTEPTRVSGDVNFYRYGGELLYHFMPESRFVPYVAAGYAGVSFDAPPAVNLDKVKAAFDYGVGFKYFMTDDVALRGDVRHLVYKRGDTLNAVEYSLGLYIPFGGTEPVAKAVEQPVIQPVVPPAPEVPQEQPQEQPQEAPLEPLPAAEPTPTHYKYCMTLKIDFDIDKADIKPEYNNEVARVGDFMKKYSTTTAVIEGHTDNVGTAEHNKELSQSRAESVVNFLVEKFGIDRSRLTASGYGMTHPLADNATEEGKQKNRRIEAVIDCALDVVEIKQPGFLCMQLLVEFDTANADIKPQYHSQIATVGEYMKNYPTTTALIEGHTDNVGGNDFNMKLSQQRAENVVNYLVEKFGIERSRLTAEGFGFKRRIAYNNTPEGRKQNRRINAVIDCVIKK